MTEKVALYVSIMNTKAVKRTLYYYRVFLIVHSLLCFHLDREKAFVETSWLSLINMRTAQDVETKQRVTIRV